MTTGAELTLRDGPPVPRLRATTWWSRSRGRRRRGVSGWARVARWLTVIVPVVAWEIGERAGWLSTLFFSSPTAIAAAGYDAMRTGDFWNDVWVSFQEFAAGYGLGLAVAVPFGLVVGWFRRARYFFDPWLNALNATPRLALLPVVVLWLGLGLSSKIAIVFLGVFISVAINTASGVNTVDRALLDVARTYDASLLRRFRTVIVPSTLPFILVGMRLGVGRAVAGVMVAEYFTSRAGLGNFIFRAGQRLQTDKLLFGAIFITVLALLGFRAIAALERRFSRWRPDIGTS